MTSSKLVVRTLTKCVRCFAAFHRDYVLDLNLVNENPEGKVAFISCVKEVNKILYPHDYCCFFPCF